ncbi:CAP domain-containing protein [Paracoccus sp. (in: a-proteobacteria)]|uniref:CAP domain-containing protein n=1 Tax=Paracoccus sp. TaxID=267 RepID=UPI00396CF7DD
MAVTIADPLELSIVEMINTEREAAGVRPVHTEVHLNDSARDHSEWMAEQQTLSHTGNEGSSPSERAEDAGFPMQGGSWSVRENVAYASNDGEVDADVLSVLHDALMNSPSHQANILDPDVDYVGVSLAQGQVQTEEGLRDVVFLTQNFGSSTQPVLVQEEVGGEAVLTSYVDGEAIPGSSQPLPKDEDTTTPDGAEDDDTRDDDQEDPQDRETASGGSCFVATAAYGSRMHPDVVTLRRFRDEILVKHRVGRAFVRLYWLVGPQLAKVVRHDRAGGSLSRGILRPCVALAARTLVRQEDRK